MSPSPLWLKVFFCLYVLTITKNSTDLEEKADCSHCKPGLEAVYFLAARFTKASSHAPGWPGWISPWVHMRNFSPVSEMRKGQRSWERVLAPNSGNKANMATDESYNIRSRLSKFRQLLELYHCSYRIYSIKRRPLSNATDGSKITNKRLPRINAAPNQENAAFIRGW